MRNLSIQELGTKIINGDRAALGRGITIIESQNKSHKAKAAELLDYIIPHSGKSVRIGITGVPGVGKSTFIETYGLFLLEKNKRIAVLAVDPSSQRTGGSILGDKTRMEALSKSEHVFIRPSPAGQQLGGLAQNTRDAILLCEAAGYDTIIVETVGVGQSEVSVKNLTDVFILLMLPGAGDELQGIKRGIIELCDLMVIHKADGENVHKAKTSRAEYARALHYFPPNEDQWKVPVLLASSIENKGLEVIDNAISELVNTRKENGNFEKNRAQQELQSFEVLYKEKVIDYFASHSEMSIAIQSLKEKLDHNQISVIGALNQIEKILSDHFQKY